jgi:hypothetical protein
VTRRPRAAPGRTCCRRLFSRRAGLGWAGLGWAGLGWAGLGWAGSSRVGGPGVWGVGWPRGWGGRGSGRWRGGRLSRARHYGGTPLAPWWLVAPAAGGARRGAVRRGAVRRGGGRGDAAAGRRAGRRPAAPVRRLAGRRARAPCTYGCLPLWPHLQPSTTPQTLFSPAFTACSRSRGAPPPSAPRIGRRLRSQRPGARAGAPHGRRPLHGSRSQSPLGGQAPRRPPTHGWPRWERARAGGPQQCARAPASAPPARRRTAPPHRHRDP